MNEENSALSRYPSLALNGTKIRKHRKSRGWEVAHLAAICDVSPRTIYRAENSDNISLETARSIASAFRLCVTDLLDNETDQTIENVIDMWLQEGEKVHSDVPNLPQHPEYVYRLSSEWKGWSDFLGTDSDNQEYETHRRIDEVENRAFRFMSVIFHHQMRRLRRRVENGEISMAVAVEIITCVEKQRDV